MFIESYEFRTPAVGGKISHSSEAIPYPAISNDDWKVWTMFLPVRTEIDHKFLTGASPQLYAQTLPFTVRHELQRANRYFDKVEVWGKHEIEKDPIAVGYRGESRYLIARWGMEKLVPFAVMKKYLPLMQAYKHAVQALPIIGGLAGLILLWNFLG